MRRAGALSLVAAAAVLLGLLAPSVASAAGGGPLTRVTVSENFGEKPTIEVETPVSTKRTVEELVVAGTGTKTAKGDRVTFDYVVVNGRTGDEIESSFETGSATIVLDPRQSITGVVNGLVGVKEGSRVLIALAPKEGVAEGLAESGVKKDDTLLIAADVVAIRRALDRAEGEAVTPPAGLPTVKLAKDGEPKISVPSTPASTTLLAQPLIKGAGPVVEAGQTITVAYKGVVYRNGKQFDSSWDRGEPVDFGIGTGQVIPGWDEGLVGQTVGSQVLLVVPPDKGYGTTGNPDAGISGTDTLVFVVDILDAF